MNTTELYKIVEEIPTTYFDSDNLCFYDWDENDPDERSAFIYGDIIDKMKNCTGQFYQYAKNNPDISLIEELSRKLGIYIRWYLNCKDEFPAKEDNYDLREFYRICITWVSIIDEIKPQQRDNLGVSRQQEQLQGKGDQGRMKTGKKITPFKDHLIVNDKDAYLAQLHRVLDTAGNPAIAKMLLKEIEQNRMTRPTFGSFKEEFPNTKMNRSYYNRHVR